MLTAWYPSSADKENLYVYLNTLQTDNPGLYSAAQALVKANNSQEFENEARIETALEFLNLAAENELQKELNFLSSKFDSSILSEIMDGNGINYPKMIAKINEANKTLDKYQAELEYEINRFNKVQASKERKKVDGKIKTVYNIGEGSHSYTQRIGSYIQATLRQLTDLSQEKEEKVTQICRNVLIKLINKTNALNGLDITQVSTILGLAQAQIMPLLEKEFQEGRLSTQSGKPSSKKIEEFITQDESYKRLLSNSLEGLQSIANNILKKFGVFDKDKQRSDYENARKNCEKATNNIKEIINSSSNTSRNRAVKKIMKFSPFKDGAVRLDIKFNSSNTGKAMEYKVANEIKNSIVVGDKGGKIDVSSFLIGDFDIGLSIKEGPINDILSSITSKTQSDFEGAGKSFETAYKELNNFLEKQRQSNSDIKNSFILHTNVKDYYATAIDGFKGFKGGIYNGLQIFDSLEALAGAGFGEADIQWLKACAVNTSKSAVGASIKSSLEEYLSIFATMLLFDDGVTIAKETAANAQASFQPLNVLHLFNVNGFYVPSSYLLRELHARLTDAANNLSANKIVKVKIEPGSVNFQKELDYLYINYVFKSERWRQIRNIQINAMAVKIYFLRNFMDILNGLTGA